MLAGDVHMFFVMEFFFYLIVISYWLYSLLEQTLLYTNQGGKIGKYIKKYNLKNIPNNLEKLSINQIFMYLKSPNGRKCIIYSISTTTVILAMKIAFTIDFFFSSYYFLKVFDKKINLYDIFQSNYTSFKIIYYLVFYIFYFILVFKYLYRKSKKKNKIEEKEIITKNLAEIGKEEEKIVGIQKNGLYQNVLITGSIGSGKTSTVITNMLDYFIKNEIPGLILDVKGNFINTVNKVAKASNSKMKIKVLSSTTRQI